MGSAVHATPFEDAIRRGKAWRLSLDAIDPTGANDRFVYIKNTGDKDLVIEGMELSSTVAGNVEPQRVSGTSDGTGATTALANLGKSAEKPDAEVDTGVDIVTLTTLFDLGHFYLIADTPRAIPLKVRLGKSMQFALNWEVATGILSGHVDMYEATEEDSKA